MRKAVVDTNIKITLSLSRHIELLDKTFSEYFIADAVWEELKNYKNPMFNYDAVAHLKKNVRKIRSVNHLSTIMDYREV